MEPPNRWLGLWTNLACQSRPGGAPRCPETSAAAHGAAAPLRPRQPVPPGQVELLFATDKFSLDLVCGRFDNRECCFTPPQEYAGSGHLKYPCRYVARGRSRIPGIRVAQQSFDLDPLQASERLAQPSAEFVSTPNDGNKRPITLSLCQSSRQESHKLIDYSWLRLIQLVVGLGIEPATLPGDENRLNSCLFNAQPTARRMAMHPQSHDRSKRASILKSALNAQNHRPPTAQNHEPRTQYLMDPATLLDD
jgi:hypothetical protein